MISKKLSSLFLIICIIQLSSAGVIDRFLTPENKDELTRQVGVETKDFLSNLFQDQIKFMNRFKYWLNPRTPRYEAIKTSVGKLELAVEKKDFEQELLWNSMETVLRNSEGETGLQDEEYNELLKENGLKKLIKNFLANGALFLWKIVKHSAKIVVAKVDRYIANWHQDK